MAALRTLTDVLALMPLRGVLPDASTETSCFSAGGRPFFDSRVAGGKRGFRWECL